MKQLFLLSFLIILEPQNIIAVNLMQQVHDYTHGGVQTTLARSRAYAWIVNSRKLAEKVVKNCALCSKEKAKLCSPVIADVSLKFIQLGIEYLHNTIVSPTLLQIKYF
ncbi:MAG: hypothetical protein GY696_10175, partial [Gammaproteobacteria bacterium]|nr:hypothetical protein [Gammaproteobacteria bacterium]